MMPLARRCHPPLVLPLLVLLEIGLLFNFAGSVATGLGLGGDGFHYEYRRAEEARFIRQLNSEHPRTRSRRDIAPTTESSPDTSDEKIPEDVEVEEDQTSEHIYYNMTTHTGKPEMMKDYFVDVETWLKDAGVEGHLNHPSLSDSYRKAAGAQIGFPFPFYGHKIQNLTIATGGFCYVGDQTHSWLAATQYVAPLMANFDTVEPGSSITYATDKKKKMIVAWNNVTLRDNREAGIFNFQVHLNANGDIYFVYKDIPMDVKDISDAHHPTKLGISDAYLFNHKFPNDKLPHSMQMKRVIHEYHRISVPAEKVTSNTVVILTALPTCLQFQDCASCSNSTLKTFNCSWCQPKNSNISGFCSDQAGLHRRRQDWVEGDCSLDAHTNAYCPVGTADTTPSSSLASSTTVETVTAPETDLENEKERLKAEAEKRAEGAGGGGGMALFVIFILLLISGGCWFLYAYFNPHTTSGQLLIKYRPSKWQLPTGHVRYSASVHM